MGVRSSAQWAQPRASKWVAAGAILFVAAVLAAAYAVKNQSDARASTRAPTRLFDPTPNVDGLFIAGTNMESLVAMGQGRKQDALVLFFSHDRTYEALQLSPQGRPRLDYAVVTEDRTELPIQVERSTQGKMIVRVPFGYAKSPGRVKLETRVGSDVVATTELGSLPAPTIQAPAQASVPVIATQKSKEERSISVRLKEPIGRADEVSYQLVRTNLAQYDPPPAPISMVRDAGSWLVTFRTDYTAPLEWAEIAVKRRKLERRVQDLVFKGLEIRSRRGAPIMLVPETSEVTTDSGLVARLASQRFRFSNLAPQYDRVVGVALSVDFPPKSDAISLDVEVIEPHPSSYGLDSIGMYVTTGSAETAMPDRSQNFVRIVDMSQPVQPPAQRAEIRIGKIERFVVRLSTTHERTLNSRNVVVRVAPEPRSP
jgi:hypothetical protein